MRHVTQKQILDLLARADTKRYSQLKPTDIDGNVFGYHLKQLITDSLVKKLEDGSYSLTEAGRSYIINRFEEPLEAAHSIFLLVIKHQEKYLVRRRTVQPTIGLSGFIHGEPKLGYSLAESARRRLLDKAGIDCPDMSVACSGLITIWRDSELESYSHAIILTGTADQEALTPGDDTGINYWADRNEFGQPNFIPSCSDLLEVLENKLDWFELNYNL